MSCVTLCALGDRLNSRVRHFGFAWTTTCLESMHLEQRQGCRSHQSPPLATAATAHPTTACIPSQCLQAQITPLPSGRLVILASSTLRSCKASLRAS